MRKENESLELMANNQTWGTKRISELQTGVKATEEKIQDSLFYREQLAFIHRRLIRNKKTMETHLHKLEGSVNRNKTDLTHLKELMRALEASKNTVLVRSPEHGNVIFCIKYWDN